MIEIRTIKSKDPARNATGGEYDFGIALIPEGNRYRVSHWTSCEVGEWCPKCGAFHDPERCSRDWEYIEPDRYGRIRLDLEDFDKL